VCVCVCVCVCRDAESLFFVGLQLQNVMCDMLIVYFMTNGEKSDCSNKVHNRWRCKYCLRPK